MASGIVEWCPYIYRYYMRYPWIHGPIISILLACDIVFNARLTRLLEPLPLQALILGGVTLLILVYMLVAFLRFYYMAVLLCVVLFANFINQMLVFQEKTGVSPDVNSFFQYIWSFVIIIFIVAARDGMSSYAVRKFAFFSTIYAGIYTILVAAFQVGALPYSIAVGMISEDVERGARLFCYATAVNFAWFVWLVKMRWQPSYKAFVGLVICGIASALAMSRVSLALLALLSLLYLVGLRAKTISRITLILFVAMTVPGFYGLYDSTWNPYSLFASDSSGGYRMIEYDIVRRFILQDPYFAFGIAPAFKGAASLLLSTEVFGSDLGAVGVWFNYGLLGLILFFLATFVASRVQSGLDIAQRHPLFLIGCFIAAFGGLAPVIVTGSCTMFAIVLANLWGNRALSTPTPQSLPWSIRRQMPSAI